MGDASSTTLFTFRIDVPSGVRSVELLGSWDNFTHSYRMERDSKRSSRHWFGIFTFKDIICDGESQSGPGKREGGLKMGGTYWYHYMLDGVYEYHDESKPFTTTCPLHLGECVNILEVPLEERSDDFDLSFPPPPVLTPPFTMDPKARFSTPRPNKFEALARKPTLPPPSPFFPSPATPSCEDSCRSSLAPSSDQNYRSSASMGSDSLPRTIYSRHGLLDRPVEPVVNQKEQRSEQRHKEVGAFVIDEDVLSDSGATLACWQHRDCLLRTRNGLAKTEAEKVFRQCAYQVVDAWIEHTTIALLDGDFPWDMDNASTCELSPTKSEFSDVLEDSMELEMGSYWAPQSFPDFDEGFISDETSSFIKVGGLARVEEEPNQESDFGDDDAGTDAMGEPLYRCISETEQFVESFELPAVFTGNTSFQEITQALAPQAQPEEEARSSTQEPADDFSSTDRFINTFVLPPLDTRVGVGDNSFAFDPALSPHSATTNATDLPQLEDSAMLSSTCSSPTTASSTWAESFHFWSEQDVGEDGMDESYLDYSSSATSPGLLPTVSHSRTSSWFSNSGFQGYSLPEDQYSSQATLTKITTQTTIVRSVSPPPQSKLHSTLRAVNSELGSMDALMTDFGYLSEAVI
ncbi:hypothetical protein GTA08_BOTSDO11429 [Neofusicoccum parvum]|nr:hypothetical protein GTA08_BOTSDO11429 [Neofusicoccum parvum]